MERQDSNCVCMWDLNISISNACCLGAKKDVVPKGSYFPFRIFVSFVDYSEDSYPEIFRTASMLIVKANLTPLTCLLHFAI